MVINTAKVAQSLPRGVFGTYEAIYPGEIVSEKVFPMTNVLSCFKKIKKIDWVKVESIALKRSYALGDVLMLIPIAKYFKTLGKEVHIHTGRDYALPSMKLFKSGTQRSMSEALIIRLDGTVEKDHSDKTLFEKSRLDIYAEYLGIKLTKIDWSTPSVFPDERFPNGVIGVQLSGSCGFKSINAVPMLKALSKRGSKVFILNKNRLVMKYSNMFWRNLNVPELLSCMKRMKGIICYDSGPLWLSHLADIPAFVIVGPTSGKKITKHHPNSKTTYYNTRIDVGCKAPCGESAVWCKRRYKCMKGVDYTRLNKAIKNWEEML